MCRVSTEIWAWLSCSCQLMKSYFALGASFLFAFEAVLWS